jgi:hypothetical protein
MMGEAVQIAKTKSPPVRAYLAFRKKHPVVGSWDFQVAVLLGVVAGAFGGVDTKVRANTSNAVIGMGAIDVALLSVTLVAAQLLLTVEDENYVQVLTLASGSIKKAAQPYLIVAGVAGLGIVFSALSSLMWPPSELWVAGSLLGIVVLLTAWTVGGTIQLIELTVWHADQRAKLIMLRSKQGRKAS